MTAKLKDKRSINSQLSLYDPESLTISDLLQIPTEFRTFQHCKLIINHVREVKFLERYMDSEYIYDLAKELRLRIYDPQTVVFKQGEVADAFYIILSGSVKIFINTPSEVKHFQNLKEIMHLGKGEGFGELALIYDSTRSATIMTHEKTELIVLDKDSFRKHIRTVQTSHISQIMDFYKDFPAFQNLQPNQIALYAGKSLLHKFPSNTVVIRQGEVPNDIFFIRSGRVKVIRRMNFKVHPKTKQINPDDPGDPTPEDIEAGNYKSMLVEIDELSNGDSFCDLALLNKEGMHYSIVCTIPCELITFPGYELTQMDAKIIKDYRSICKPYPEDMELRRVYLDIIRWDRWKKQLINNVHTENYNRRNDYNVQLRKAPKKFKTLAPLSIPLQADNAMELLDIITDTASIKTAKNTMHKRLGTDYKLEDALSDLPTGISILSSRSKGNPLDYNVLDTYRTMPRTSRYTTERKVTSPREEIPTKKFDFVIPKHKLKLKEKQFTMPKLEMDKAINIQSNPLGNKFSTVLSGMQSSLRLPMPVPPHVVDSNILRRKSNVFGDQETPQTKTFEKMFQDIGLSTIKLPPLPSSITKFE
jgi:cAMP-dependent protein kinase regulator